MPVVPTYFETSVTRQFFTVFITSIVCQTTARCSSTSRAIVEQSDGNTSSQLTTSFATMRSRVMATCALLPMPTLTSRCAPNVSEVLSLARAVGNVVSTGVSTLGVTSHGVFAASHKTEFSLLVAITFSVCSP